MAPLDCSAIEVGGPGARAVRVANREYRAATPELVEALSLTALLAATLQYAILVRHRAEERDAIQWRAEVRESLVSVGRPHAGPARHWTQDGTRFRVER